MTFEKFMEFVENELNVYLKNIQIFKNQNLLSNNVNTLIYPNILLFTNCNGYYVAELMGATKQLNKLKIKIHKQISIYEYLGQFNDNHSEPVFSMQGKHTGLEGLIFSRGKAIKDIERKFPNIKFEDSSVIFTDAEKKGCFISFHEDFESTYFEDSLFVNKEDEIYRSKKILSIFIVRNTITKINLKSYFEHVFSAKNVRIIQNLKDEKSIGQLLASQLQNIYYFPKL